VQNPPEATVSFTVTVSNRDFFVACLDNVNLGAFHGPTTQIVNTYSALYNLIASAPVDEAALPANVTPITARSAETPVMPPPPATLPLPENAPESAAPLT
jgi:hypothetical protein